MNDEHPDQKQLAELLSYPYSVETQSKIAKLLNKGGKDSTHDFASEELFEGVMMFLSLISSKVVGVEMALNHSLATAVLGKICVTATSVQSLFRGYEQRRLPFLDHSSIATLCRSIIKSSIMYWYLMESVSEEEWAFRLLVLKIHDTAARVRLFKPLIAEAANNQRQMLQSLRDELSAMPLFRKKQEEQRSKIRGGQVMFVNGMRSVVESMNFESEYFDSVYNYLSAYSHTSPLSYFRDGPNYHEFNEELWRRTFSQYALHHAWVMMTRIGVKELEVSNLEGQFDAELVNELKRMASGRPKSAVPRPASSSARRRSCRP